MLKRLSAWALFTLCLSFSFSNTLEARGKFPPFRERAPCKTPERCWVDADYLYWNFKNSPEPVPLVIESPVLQNVIIGGKDIHNDWRSGGKLALGYWFDNSCQLGGEVSYLTIPNGSMSKKVVSDGSLGSVALYIPYIDVLSGTEHYSTLAEPGVFSGTGKLKITNNMQSAEVNVIALVPCDSSLHLVMLAGLRYWGFCENLSFKTNSPNIPPFPTDVYKTTDRFQAENHFYGGQVGTKIEYTCGGFFSSIQGKVAFGTMHQQSDIKGQLLTNDFNGFGAAEKFPGGYFTMPSNLKSRKTECYAVIPEGNITFGYQVTDALSLQIGYTIIFVNNVFRPGNEIDRNINPTQSATLSNTPTPVLVGEARPKSSLKSSMFYAHGLNAGIKFAF
jgi:hypothetical protein